MRVFFFFFLRQFSKSRNLYKYFTPPRQTEIRFQFCVRRETLLNLIKREPNKMKKLQKHRVLLQFFFFCKNFSDLSLTLSYLSGKIVYKVPFRIMNTRASVDFGVFRWKWERCKRPWIFKYTFSVRIRISLNYLNRKKSSKKKTKFV